MSTNCIVKQYKLSDLIRQFEQEADSAVSEIGQVRATLMVNYGPEGKTAQILKDETEPTISQLVQVLEYYHTKNKQLEELVRELVDERKEIHAHPKKNPKKGEVS